MNDRKLKETIIGAAGCLIAIIAACIVSAGGDKFFFLSASVCVAIGFWFLVGDIGWMVLFATLSLNGTFNFIPFEFRPYELCAMLLIARFIINHVLLSQRGIKVGLKIEFVLLLGFVIIVAMHAVKNKMGMRIFGSSVWGGRAYVTVALSFICYLAVLSSNLSRRALNSLPWVCLAPALFDLTIQLATYFSGTAAMIIYQYYSAVSTQAVVQDAFGRVSSYGNVGLAIEQLSLSYLDFRVFLLPRMLGPFFSSLAGLVLCVASGFRSVIINGGISFMVGAVRDMRWMSIIFVALGAGVITILPAIHVGIHPLPIQMQRALVWMPGNWDWDQDAVMSAEDSNFFRYSVWDMWYQTQFKEHPLLGRGFGFNFEDFNALEAAARSGSSPNRDDSFETFVISGQLHNSLFSALDRVGVVGTVFAILWIILVGLRVIRIVLASHRLETSVATKYLCLVLGVQLLTFWFGSLTFEAFLPTVILASAFLQKSSELEALDRKTAFEITSKLYDQVNAPVIYRPVTT